MYVPPHLYGQLVQHNEGTEVVLNLPYLSDFFDIIRTHCLREDTNIKEVKAAIWAVVSKLSYSSKDALDLLFHCIVIFTNRVVCV